MIRTPCRALWLALLLSPAVSAHEGDSTLRLLEMAPGINRLKTWILIAALVFRAMPHITLVSGYLLPFFELNIWGHIPTAVIVLVARLVSAPVFMRYAISRSLLTASVGGTVAEPFVPKLCSRMKYDVIRLVPS